ncbi:MAG: hypothetical protein HS127_20550 [Planctomycetia bacterium]|nr:hypothetical protein [Planctomycetia bacterium]
MKNYSRCWEGKILGITIMLETWRINSFHGIRLFLILPPCVSSKKVSNGKKGEGNKRMGINIWRACGSNEFYEEV